MAESDEISAGSIIQAKYRACWGLHCIKQFKHRIETRDVARETYRQRTDRTAANRKLSHTPVYFIFLFGRPCPALPDSQHGETVVNPMPSIAPRYHTTYSYTSFGDLLPPAPPHLFQVTRHRAISATPANSHTIFSTIPDLILLDSFVRGHSVRAYNHETWGRLFDASVFALLYTCTTGFLVLRFPTRSCMPIRLPSCPQHSTSLLRQLNPIVLTPRVFTLAG